MILMKTEPVSLLYRVIRSITVINKVELVELLIRL
jgi:hypothetical protein